MVMCSTMDSVVIPRPPALPLGPLISNHSLKGLSIPPPPPPKPTSEAVQAQSRDVLSVCQVSRDQETREKKVYEEKLVHEERRKINKMVEENISKNESVRSKRSNRSTISQRSNGFRLIDNTKNGIHQNNSNDDSGSVYSIYKQKIDSMFESDSSTSHTSNHNSVQAKIEKMFSEVARDNGIPANQIGVHAFSVDYLGSVPLQDKVTSLSGLQRPLRDLYFSYKKMTKSKKVLSGRLEISSQGLRVQYQGQSGDLEQMNSFPTIAVWSAVKFVLQENSSSVHGSHISYAFLPLITDPDNMDKHMLFKNLEEAEKKYISNNEEHSPLFAVVMRKIGVQKQLECHGFVCQTSEDAIVIAATLYKSLVNHMKHKERKPKNKNGVTTCMSTASSTLVERNNIPVRPPRRKRSNAGSSVCSDTTSIANISDTQPLLPNKPPKKSTKTKRAPKAPDQPNQDDLDAILPYEEPTKLKLDDSNVSNNEENQNKSKEFKPKTFTDKINTFMSKEQKQLAAEIKQVVSDSSKGLKSVQSLTKSNEETIRKKEHSGDIFTKVTIPRSGSFLNTGGLTRYKSKGSRNNESTSGGSPLGFKEIFHELSVQEGLHSLDEILSVIIDPDGMSFNDLKPIYKEFLLKLAVTLTKDELFLKSKSIMRRQKRKTIKRTASVKRSPHKLVSGKFKRLKHIFQKNLKPKSSKKLLENNSKTIEIIPTDIHNGSKLAESSISTSSYDTRQFRTKDELGGKKTSYKKKTHGEFVKSRRRERASTSEESDFFSLKRQNKYKKQNANLLALNQNRNSSSGYVSCSECSYDSDTCTCVSADKCYCSLGQRNFGSNRKTSVRNRGKYISTDDPSLCFCECDTDSCAESNKCYCQYGSQRLKTSHRNTLQHAHHPNCTKNNEIDRHKHKKLCKSSSNTKSTRSLEYMANPSEGYYEKLRSKQKFGSERVHSHYSHQTLQKKRRNSHSGIGVVSPQLPEQDFNMIALQNLQMGVAGGKLSAMDCELLKLARGGGFGELKGFQEAMFGGAFSENFKDYWNGTRGLGARDPGLQRVQSAITTGACTEALSVKKSAEIAALFADIKLSQTTDITHLAAQGFNVDKKNIYNMEKSLQAKYSKPNKGPYASADISATPFQKPPLQVSNYARPSSIIKNKSKLYSSKNGLYTIQSQSDESRHSGSRRSSLSGDGRKLSVDELERYGSRRNTSSSIENSLGYLP